MIESRFEHKPPVDDLRLAEIEGWWEKCKEEEAACLAVAEAGTDAELRNTVREASASLNHLLEEIVPELIVDLRRRNAEREGSKHG